MTTSDDGPEEDQGQWWRTNGALPRDGWGWVRSEGAPGSLRPKAVEEALAVTQWREEEVPAEEATCIKAW